MDNETTTEIINPDATVLLEKQLLKTSWVKEAELIKKFVPEEDLSKSQIKLLDKCIAKEDFTDKQFTDLKLLLNKYRLILQELKPDEALENVEKAVEIIKTEQEFIDMMEASEEKYLVVHLPYHDRLIEFEFEVLPLNDSRVIDSLQLQIDLFRDFDFDEATVYSNASNKNPEDLTDEEKRIVKKLNGLIADKLSTGQIDSTDNFLANQLKIKGSDADVETRKQFWKKFHFNAKFSVFVAVQKRLGLDEISDEKLFPAGR